MTKIAAYDADGIYGVGDTEEQARAEAAGYLREMFADPNDEAAERTIAGLRCAPIDAELLAEVHRCGSGYEVFALADGVLVPSMMPFSMSDEGLSLLEEVAP